MAVEALSPDHGEAQRLLKLSYLIMAKLKRMLKLTHLIMAKDLVTAEVGGPRDGYC